MPRWPRHLLRWRLPRTPRPGHLLTLPGVHSPELDNTRDIQIYLPHGYGSGARRYPVIYMHDGQNLFDPRTSFAGAWRVDEAMESASRKGQDAIVVGIPHMEGERIGEFNVFPDTDPPGRGERYLAFIAGTLKPLVDAHFRTRSAAIHTGIVGSSMGGLISLAGFFLYPRVFGFVGALSPSLWFHEGGMFPLIEAAPFVRGRIYLDMGTMESANGLVHASRLRDLLVAKGYRTGDDLQFVVDRGGRHSEAAWGRRFRKALPFLLGGRRQGARRLDAWRRKSRRRLPPATTPHREKPA